MSKSQILAYYGKEISKKDLDDLKDDGGLSDYRTTYSDVVSYEDEPIPGYPESEYRRVNLVPVYDVEWLDTDDDGVMQRYNCIRIGSDVYILRGIDHSAIRTQSNPNICGLSVNGVYFLNRSQTPYSLILKCAHLQDRYDLLIYYRDNLIANSGTSGTIMDMSLIPANLGVQWPERVQKWLAYKKAGVEWIDTTQEGRNDNGNAPMNTIFNGFDDTLKAQAVQAIEVAIQSVEQTTSSITGVFRERLNGIEQRDAVSNIKQGVNNSFIITKHYFQQMDLVTCEILLDCLNQAKTTYKNGLTGTLILGDKYQKIFTALPEHFTLTDFDIHITASTEVMQDLLTIKQMIPELVKIQALPPEVIFEALTTKSLSDLRYKVKKALQKQKEENNQIQQLSQQLQQTQQELQQAQQELQKAQQQVKQLDSTKMELEQKKIQLEYQVDWYKAQTDNAYKTRQMDIEEQRTQIELAQLRDGNPYNNKIKRLL